MSNYTPRDFLSFSPIILDALIADGNYEAQKTYSKAKIESLGEILSTAVIDGNQGLANRMLVKIAHEMQISCAYGFISKTELTQYQINFTNLSYDANVANFFFNTVYEENGKISENITTFTL